MKRCKYCGNEITDGTRAKTYCNDSCRVSYHQNKGNAYERQLKLAHAAMLAALDLLGTDASLHDDNSDNATLKQIAMLSERIKSTVYASELDSIETVSSGQDKLVVIARAKLVQRDSDNATLEDAHEALESALYDLRQTDREKYDAIGRDYKLLSDNQLESVLERVIS